MAFGTAVATLTCSAQLSSAACSPVLYAHQAAFTPTHTIKKLPVSKMDDVYQHPLIQV
jgi:hypothetical protein